MKLLEFSPSESLDRDNPWVLRIVFGGGRKWWFLRSLPMLALLTIAPLYAIFWALALLFSENSEDIRFLCSASAYLLLLAAFVAPAAGVGARYRLDRSRMLGDSFQTPLPWRAYVAAVHGRVLVYTVYAGSLAVAFSAAYLAIQFSSTPGWRVALEASQLAAIADMLPAVRWRPKLTPVEVAQVFVLVALMAMCFTSGVYARASINAAVSPVGIAPVVVTALLLGVTMASFSIRYLLIQQVTSRLLGLDDSALRIILGFVELGLTAFRLFLARKAWQRVLASKTRDGVVSQVVGAP